MARPKKKPGEAFTHDARAKVPKAVYDKIAAEAKSRMLTPSDILRELLLEKYGPPAEGETKKGK